MNPSQKDAFKKACAWQGWTPTYPGFDAGDHQKLFTIGTKKRNVLIYRPLTFGSNYVVHLGYISDSYNLNDEIFSFPTNATSAKVFVAMSKILARIEQKVYELNRAT